MKVNSKFAGGLLVLAAAAFSPLQAARLTVIHSFTGSGSGGMFPYTNLLQAGDGSFYGTASGGSAGLGIVFNVTPAGAFTTVASFNGSTGTYPSYENLAQGSDGNIYGTTENGGGSNYGTVFQMTPAGALGAVASFTGTYESGSAGLIGAVTATFTARPHLRAAPMMARSTSWPCRAAFGPRLYWFRLTAPTGSILSGSWCRAATEASMARLMAAAAAAMARSLS